MPERHPLLLAKEVAALDLYSGGRFQFGIGTGWLREETEIFGGDFPRRWTQTREALDVMKLCWTEEEAEYHGKYYDFPPVRSFPKPTQQPYPPILIGGMAPNVLKRIVAHADGWLPNRVSAQDIENSRKKLEALCAEAGRDPSSIEIVIYGQAPDKAELQSLVDAGADSVVVKPEWVETEAEMGEQLERMAGLVL